MCGAALDSIQRASLRFFVLHWKWLLFARIFGYPDSVCVCAACCRCNFVVFAKIVSCNSTQLLLAQFMILEIAIDCATARSFLKEPQQWLNWIIRGGRLLNGRSETLRLSCMERGLYLGGEAAQVGVRSCESYTCTKTVQFNYLYNYRTTIFATWGGSLTVFCNNYDDFIIWWRSLLNGLRSTFGSNVFFVRSVTEIHSSSIAFSRLNIGEWFGFKYRSNQGDGCPSSGRNFPAGFSITHWQLVCTNKRVELS